MLEPLERRQLLSADITVSLTGNEILLSGDTTVTSLSVSYDPAGETYAFVANSGVSFVDDGSLPGTVSFSQNANSAAIAPSGGQTWAGLGYYVGTDLTATTGSAIALGSPTAPASKFGTQFDVANSSGGTTALTIDDSDDISSPTVSVTDSSLTIGSAPAITFGGATFTGLTFDGSTTGGTAVDVAGAPTATSPLTLAMGAGATNTIDLGNSTGDAFGLGSMTITSAGSGNALTVDDSQDPSGQTIALTGSTVSFTGGPTFDFSGATLDSLEVDASNAGSNTVTVTSTPGGVEATLAMGSGSGNTVDLGDASHAAAALGSLTITGTTGLTVDDSADTAASTVSITTSSLSFASSQPAFHYAGASLTGLAFDSDAYATMVAVTVSPAAASGPAPITLIMGGSTSNEITLGDSAHAASALGAVTMTGTTGLTIDDTNDSTSGQTVYIDYQTMTIGTSPTIDYSGAVLSSFTYDAGVNGTGLTVHKSPTSPGPVLAPMTLNMGSSPNNTVQLGDSEADTLGDVTLTGDMGLAVTDSNGSGSWTIGVTATSIGFADGSTSNTFDYSGATLSSLSLQTDNNGGNAVNVIGMPSLPSGVAMSIGTFAGSGDAYNLGDSTHAASLLGSVDLGPSGDGTTTLSIDDSAGALDGTITATSSSVAFIGGPTFDYSGHYFASLTLDASDLGGTTVDAQGSPHEQDSPTVVLSPITLAMGTGTGNTVGLGDSMNAADDLGSVTVTTGSGGKTGLMVDDSPGPVSWVYCVTGTAISLTGGPTFTYCGASLSDLELKTTNAGGDTVNVNGTPSLPAGNPLSISTSSGAGDAVNLGHSTHTASGLGNISIASGAGAPLAVTIDDSAGPAGATIGIAPSVNFGVSGPTFDLSGATLSGLTIDASTLGTTTVCVSGSPAGSPGLAPIILNMGSGSGSAVHLGDSNHAASGLGNVNLASDNPGQVALAIDDSADPTGQTISVSYSDLTFGASGPDFDYSPADVALSGLTLDASDHGSNTVGVGSSPLGAPVILNMGSGTSNAITLGGSTHPADVLNGNFTITTGGMAPNLGSTSLTIEDSNDLAGQTIGVTATQACLNGLTFDYGGARLTGLTLDAGSGDDTVNVTGSPAAVSGLAPIILAMGASTKNAVNLGSPSSVASGLGGVTVTGTTGLTIDDSADASSRSTLLEYDSTSHLSDLTGLSASTFAFNCGVTTISLVPSSSPTVSTTLTVDFSQGNPLPAGAATSFTFNGLLGASNALVLQGELPGSTPLDSEAYTPTPARAGAGAITLTVASATSTLNFDGLTPIDDTVPATHYTFTAPSSARVVNITTGPIIDTYQTDTISSGDNPSSFELVNFANKADVLVDLTNINDPTYVQPPSTPATGLNNLTIQYFGSSTSGHVLNVTGTTAGSTTTIQLGGKGNMLVVQSVTADGPLVIENVPGSPGAVNSVSIGDNGSLANIAAGVTILGPSQSTLLTVDGSAETTPFGDMLLELNAGQTLADMTGLLPGGLLAYDPAALNSFTLNSGSGADSLAIDFVHGNPFLGAGVAVPPVSPYTLNFDGGGGGDSLTFQDTSALTAHIFDTEDYAPSGAHSGTVEFYDATSPGTSTYQGGVDFTNLTPTIDSTPVTNYTFTAPSSGGTVSMTDGAAGYTLISDPSASPTFESVAYSNKTNVTIDASAVSRNNLFVLSDPAAATGQTSLSVKLGRGNDTVNVSANPAGVAATIDGGVGSQAVTVNGAGLAAGTTSANLSILGGTGPDVLRLNAQGTGTTAALSPGTPTGPAVAAFGTGAGSTSLAFINMGVIQEFATNHAPTLTIASPLPTIATQPGLPLVDIPVATFNDVDLIETAASYQASINWGDGSPPTTGTITAVPGTPGQYIISGSHTYPAAGQGTITVTLTDLGGTFNSTLGNAGGAVVPVATQLDAIAAVNGGTAKVSVASLQLVSTSAMAATAGTPATGPLAVFSDANGPTDPGVYYAMVNWGDGTGLTGATIVADSTTQGNFDISGTHTYAAPGTYSGTIEVYGTTGHGLSIPIGVTVQSPSVVVTSGLSFQNGVPSAALRLATVSVPFFLGSPGLDFHNYEASVDYGDGSPTVPSTLVPASIGGATAFSVMTSGHAYATPGAYTLSVAIRDGAGFIVGTGSAPVTVNDPPPPDPDPSAPGISWGRLGPQSDSGVSDGDGITNVTTPTFVGASTPGAVIQVFEIPAGSSAAPTLIATGVANDSGAWSATVVGAPMADGSYQISAKATNGGGSTSASLGTVVIDTVAPVITNVVFNRLRGELDLYFQDNLSGLYLPDLSNGANVKLSANPLNGQMPVRKVMIPTSIAVTSGGTATGVDEATVLFNHGKALPGGHYTIQVLAAGISDVAGNMLAGRFYGSYPTGNVLPGSNYVAQITAFPRRVLGAFPIQAGYAKPKPMVSNQRSPQVVALARSRPASVVQARGWVNGSNRDLARLVDQAIASLAGINPSRRGR